MIETKQGARHHGEHGETSGRFLVVAQLHPISGGDAIEILETRRRGELDRLSVEPRHFRTQHYRPWLAVAHADEQARIARRRGGALRVRRGIGANLDVQQVAAVAIDLKRVGHPERLYRSISNISR